MRAEIFLPVLVTQTSLAWIGICQIHEIQQFHGDVVFLPRFADWETKQACKEAKQVVQVDKVVTKRIKSVFFNIVHILS